MGGVGSPRLRLLFALEPEVPTKAANRSSESSVTSGDIDIEAIIKRLPLPSMHRKTGQSGLLSKVEITSAGNSSIMEIPTEDNAAGGR